MMTAADSKTTETPEEPHGTIVMNLGEKREEEEVTGVGKTLKAATKDLKKKLRKIHDRHDDSDAERTKHTEQRCDSIRLYHGHLKELLQYALNATYFKDEIEVLDVTIGVRPTVMFRWKKEVDNV